MNQQLIISIYPRNRQIACLVLKQEDRPYRINFLWQYVRLVVELENAAKQSGDYKTCLELFDKRDNKWAMLLSIAGRTANLVLWFISLEDRHQSPKFSWSGTAGAFRRAVRGMLLRLPPF